MWFTSVYNISICILHADWSIEKKCYDFQFGVKTMKIITLLWPISMQTYAKYKWIKKEDYATYEG